MGCVDEQHFLCANRDFASPRDKAAVTDRQPGADVDGRMITRALVCAPSVRLIEGVSVIRNCAEQIVRCEGKCCPRGPWVIGTAGDPSVGRFVRVFGV
jgi:hypothetical protein